MTVVPRHRAGDPVTAADDNEAEQEYRLYVSFAAKSQDLVANLADLRFQRTVARLHHLGARPLFEMLVELGLQHLIRTEIEAAVNRYAALDPELLCAVGADTFPPVPVHVVGAAR